MEMLRIELLREIYNLLGVDQMRRADPASADVKIFQIEFLHKRFEHDVDLGRRGGSWNDRDAG
jgi:hypothetical protein